MLNTHIPDSLLLKTNFMNVKCSFHLNISAILIHFKIKKNSYMLPKKKEKWISFVAKNIHVAALKQMQRDMIYDCWCMFAIIIISNIFTCNKHMVWHRHFVILK